MSVFPSQYPIVQAVMNQVSRPELAAAVDEAGAFASLWIIDYQDNQFNLDYAHDTLKEFQRLTGHSRVLVGVPLSEITNPDFVSLLQQFKIGYAELWGLISWQGHSLDFDYVYGDPDTQQHVKNLRSWCKIFPRITNPVESTHLQLFDGLCLKGKESAGLSGTITVKELFHAQRNHNPNAVLIPYGGIGTPEQVKDYIELGAPAVAVGTLFAATQESPLSQAVKIKMTQSNQHDLVRDTTTGQNLLCLAQVKDDANDWNRTDQLRQGIHGNGQQGLIYAGHAIDHVTSIRSVKETVLYLSSLLK